MISFSNAIRELIPLKPVKLACLDQTSAEHNVCRHYINSVFEAAIFNLSHFQGLGSLTGEYLLLSTLVVSVLLPMPQHTYESLAP